MRIMLFLGLVTGILPRASSARAADEAGIAFFETKIRPVLVAHCYECHSQKAKKPKGAFLLDSRDALRKGGETGPAIVPGNADESLLIKAVRYTDDAPHM